jgi:hypothetical protein
MYRMNPAYALQGANNPKRAARATGRTRKGDKHESHTSRWDWSYRKANEAPSKAVQRTDLIAEYNARLGV